MVLETLAQSSRLAFHVKVIGEPYKWHILCFIDQTRKDFRDYPTHLTVDEKLQLIALASRAINNCVNLLSCSWTRDGSLNTKIIESLANLEKLRALEINGRPGPWTAWVPEDLLRFRQLQSLTLIMPVQTVVEVLPEWAAQNSETLESLVVICKSTTALNDSTLFKMSSSLYRLRRFHLAGCTKVTEGSIKEVISRNAAGLESLAGELLATPRYGRAWDFEAFGIQRLIIPLDALRYAIAVCLNLEDVFVTLCGVNRDDLAQTLASGNVLRNVHTTLMTDVTGVLRPIHLATAQSMCQHVVQYCSASLRIIGAQTRVWKVTRHFSGKEAIVTLGAYSGPQIPEQFLMIRA
ncbi:hypothetical protein RhiJN_12900 [Ceratobasidium sp. AG-Ba]|nr:hypothetical protein RhiJN_12900 [Ceratobasidium sp. AG-Ba]